MFVCMGQHHRIRRLDANTGVITLVAGTGDSGYSGDGGPALRATFNMPYALTVDTNGDIDLAERGNPIVRNRDGRTGLISTLAGTGEKGYGGDGGPANKALLREPNDVCLDGQGGLLIADVQDQRIRRVDCRRVVPAPLRAPARSPAPAWQASHRCEPDGAAGLCVWIGSATPTSVSGKATGCGR